jgi:uncharacterized protein (TIGR00369 family)
VTDRELVDLLRSQQWPVCAELMPFEILDADRDRGWVRLSFAPQPAFGNHFGGIQGGFLVAMLDVPMSAAIFAKTGRFLPTVEIKTSFLRLAPLGVVVAEGAVVRAGSQMVFAESRAWTEDGTLLAHATATAFATQA